MDQPHDEDQTFTGVDKLDGTSEGQKEEVRQQSRPNAALIHETIRAEGIGELERSLSALAFSGLAAGLSMGFSMLVEGVLRAHLPPGPAREVLAPLGYSIGFLIVVLGRQQLFTENTLTPVLPLLHDTRWELFRKVLRLWSAVLATNLAGALIFAIAVAKGSFMDQGSQAAFLDLGREALAASPGQMLLKAICAGWLIALMVWLLPAAEGAKAFVIVILAYVVALCHFSHVIASSVDVAYAVLSGAASWNDFLARFFLPTLCGNVLGGVALVAVLNYGQVAPEIGETS